MNELDPMTLFRLSVLGSLVSRPKLERGEATAIAQQLAQQPYVIPGSRREYLAPKTILAWYRGYRREGLAGLAPQRRSDQGVSKIEPAVQEILLELKREKPRRSVRTLRQMVEASGLVARSSLSRSAIHRLLQQHGLSRPVGAASEPAERRSFAAEHAGDIWYGDVMHGPRVLHEGRLRKSYLVSLMDDASRLIVHSAFCLAEDALAIEAMLKQAVLKRGLCTKLIVDNGAAYRSGSLQGICARLGINLIYCRPYQPEGKGKIERWHRTIREQFLSELCPNTPLERSDLNARLWAYLEQVYHRTPHSGLNGMTPLTRYQQDLPHVRTLGTRAAQLDAIFHYRVPRTVRKDGTVSYEGRRFEVPYELAGKNVRLIVDPHTATAVAVEDEHGAPLGSVTPLNALANRHRKRHKPTKIAVSAAPAKSSRPTLVDLAYAQHYGPIAHSSVPNESTAEEV